MDNRGLKDRAAFQESVKKIMAEQGIAAVGIAFVTDEGYADFEGVQLNMKFDLDKMRQSLNELLDFCDEVERQRKKLD